MLDPSRTRINEDTDRFCKALTDEQWCLEYLFTTRWPDGFICPCCQRTEKSLPPKKRIVCPACGHAVTITSGTLLHGTKKSLSEWLRAAWFICSEKNNSTRKLQQYLKVNNYQTAWNWMQKFRLAIKHANSAKCSGTVEVGDVLLNFRNNTNSYHILAALEISIQSDSTARLQLDFCKKLTGERIQLFIKNHIMGGSTLILPESEHYRVTLSPEFICVFEPRQSIQAHTGNILNRFIENCSTHTFVASADKQLEKYLNEFCFHHNNRTLANPITIFDNFIATILSHGPRQKYRCPASSELIRGTA